MMPHSIVHKKKLKKNLTIAGMVFLWCAAIWVITMIKIARADEMMDTHQVEYAPANERGAFFDRRGQHLDNTRDTHLMWEEDFKKGTDKRASHLQKSDLKREKRLQDSVNTHDMWNKKYLEAEDGRKQEMTQSENRRESWEKESRDNPYNWWQKSQSSD
jgi:hypothetical protein